jgi:lipopolysaccharide export system permease protein
MSGLTRYVLWQLTVGMIFVTTGLACVIWLMQSLRFVDMIVNSGLTAGMFLYLTMLKLPDFLTIILPIALFTIVAFTYSKLITDRELVVMRASGMSQIALAKPALILATIVVMLGYAINLYLLPNSYRLFNEMKWDRRYAYSGVVLQEGAFTRMMKGVTVYVRERSKEDELHGILVHDERNKEKPTTYMATRGALVQTGEQPRIILFGGNRQEVDRKTNKFSILYFDRTTYDIENKKKEVAIRYREARERTVGELFSLEEDALLNRKDYGKFTVEGHKRLISPFLALGFTLVGLACLISGGVSRRGQTRRIILAVAIVCLLQISALGLENVCARKLELVPLMYVNGVLPIVLGFLFMLRSVAGRGSKTAEPLVAEAS